VTALSAEWPQDPAYKLIHRAKVPMAAGVKAWRGASFAWDTRTGSASKGYALPAGTQTTVSATTNSTGQFLIGRARETVDNTNGANGATAVEVDFLGVPKRIIFRANSGTNAVTAAMRGSLCYSEDDATVGSSSSGFSQAGRVWDVLNNGAIVAVEML
jgi:hypothetical protein